MLCRRGLDELEFFMGRIELWMYHFWWRVLLVGALTLILLCLVVFCFGYLMYYPLGILGFFVMPPIIFLLLPEGDFPDKDEAYEHVLMLERERMRTRPLRPHR
jgi:hypothetical protein